MNMTKEEMEITMALAENKLDSEKLISCLITNGCKDKEKIFKKTGIQSKGEFNKKWNNLKKAGYFNNGKIVMDSDFEEWGVIPFYLMLLCADGLVTRTFDKPAEVEK